MTTTQVAESSVKNSKLPGLNGLRALAAGFVLISHVYQISGDYGDAWAKKIYWHHNLLGVNMVNLFFVISGFIITHILFQEQTRTGTISLRNFYFKRVLRIWPLYFGVLLLALGIGYFTDWYTRYPAINGNGLLLICLFLMNFSLFVQAPQISVLQHYWSLSIEEQFYIFWPPFFKYLKGKRSLYFPLGVLLGIIACRALVVILYKFHPSQLLLDILETLSISKFGSISLGVIAAWLLHHRHTLLQWVYRPGAQFAGWAVLFGTIIFNYKIPYIHFEVTAFFYAIVVLNVTSNVRTFITAENRFLDHLGKVSYGLYMFHWPLIPLLIVGAKRAGLWDFLQQTYQIPLLIFSCLMTWCLSSISFKYFESFFLKMRPLQMAAKPINKSL